MHTKDSLHGIGDRGWRSRVTRAVLLAPSPVASADLQCLMRPPNDGHRRNILSSTFTVVGVDIYLDPAHGRLWLTEDFARLA